MIFLLQIYLNISVNNVYVMLVYVKL